MTNNHNHFIPNQIVPRGNGYIITMPSTNTPYGNISQMPILYNPPTVNRPIFTMNSMFQEQVSSSVTSQTNPSSSSSSSSDPNSQQNGQIDQQEQTLQYTEQNQNEMNVPNRSRRIPNDLQSQLSSTNSVHQRTLTEAQRKQKETNLRNYTRLFQMWLLKSFGYDFKMKNKRHQTGKKVLYSISKIILSERNEELINRSERELYARQMFSNGITNDKQKKTVDKFVDECIDNLMIELLELCGYNLDTKVTPMFRDARRNEELLRFKKYTLMYIDVKDEMNMKRLSREQIFEEYKIILDKFAETLTCD